MRLLFLISGNFIEGDILARLRLVVLREDEVPYLQIAVAVAAHAAGRLPAAALLAEVDIDFRVRAAGAGADFPEIVLELHDMALGKARLLLPNLCRLVVLRVDGHIELLLRKLHHLRQKLPSPRDGLRLEIIPEGKIAQHLEIRLMARRAAHVLDVARADAALARGDARAGRLHLAREEGLEGGHARADHEERRVVLGNQRRARQPQMPLRLEKFEIRLAQFITRHMFHRHQLPDK